MKTPLASAKLNSSIVMVVDNQGIKKYHVRNQVIVKENDVMWELARTRYRRAIRIFREDIDNLLKETYSVIPVYRDSDIAEICQIIRCQWGRHDLALTIFEFIESKKDGKQEEQSGTE